MSARIQLVDVRALLCWAPITAFLFTVLNLVIIQLNLEPPEPIGQMLISLAVFFVYTTVICSIVGLVLGLAFVALTRTRMQSGRSIGAVHGALLGLASVAVGTALFSFSGPTSSILVVLLLGAMCGASAGAIVGYKATESTST